MTPAMADCVAFTRLRLDLLGSLALCGLVAANDNRPPPRGWPDLRNSR